MQPPPSPHHITLVSLSIWSSAYEHLLPHTVELKASGDIDIQHGAANVALESYRPCWERNDCGEDLTTTFFTACPCWVEGLCLLSYDSWTCFGNCSGSPWTWRWILSLFPVRRMTRLPLAPQRRHPPAALLTQPSRVGWAAWAMASGWRGTTWGHSSLSSSSAAWFWPSSTSCRPLFMEDLSKTLCFLWSSMSVGPGLIQTSRTLQDQPRCLEMSPPHTWRKWLLTNTETMRQSEEDFFKHQGLCHVSRGSYLCEKSLFCKLQVSHHIYF